MLELRQPAAGGCGLQKRNFCSKEECQSAAIVASRCCNGNNNWILFAFENFTHTIHIHNIIHSNRQINTNSSPGDFTKNNMSRTIVSANNDGSSANDGSHRGGSGSASGSRSQIKTAKKVTISSTTTVAHESKENPLKKAMLSQTAPAQLHTHRK